MTHGAIELSELHGEELVEALQERFTTVESEVAIGSETFSILRPSNSDDLIREEDFVKDERLPYWADIWPSSTILARHFIEISKSGRPRNPGRGLELGCGVGIVTIAAMIAGYDMIASDYYTDALAFTRANAFRNTGREPQAPMIDWRHFPDDVTGLDLVLASDVLYEKEYARLLPNIFRKALAPGGMAIVADPGRIGVPEFLDECRKVGLVIRSKTPHAFEEGEIRQQIDLYEVADAKS